MQAVKVKGKINQQGKLIIQDSINLNQGEVEVIILQSDFSQVENTISTPKDKPALAGVIF